MRSSRPQLRFSFIELAVGNDVNWEANPTGDLPEPGRLLTAAATLRRRNRMTFGDVARYLNEEKSYVPTSKVGDADVAIWVPIQGRRPPFVA